MSSRSVSPSPSRWRAVSLVLLAWAVAMTFLWWQERSPAPAPEVGFESDAAFEERPEQAPGPSLRLRPESFDALPGWSQDGAAEALPAFRRSCSRFAVFADSRELKPSEIGGTVADWRGVCAQVTKVPSEDHLAARAFFEDHFVPMRVVDRDDSIGTFTGYYEPLLQGSRRRSERYRVPLLRHPRDIVTMDLTGFADDLDGRRIAGRWVGGKFRPYPDRGEIVDGALAGRGLELLWVDDPVDAFFLQVQGSGRVLLEEGGSVRVGYAGQNGHAYYAVGRALIEWGEVPREEMSMQAIRRWLEENPDRRKELLDLNRSYVFFRQLDQSGPVGSQGVVLTPGRSLAVDRSHIPMGVPLFLETWVPVTEPDELERDDLWQEKWLPWRRLMVAQDTGGAIKGAVRGDIFFGSGKAPGAKAGMMNFQGRYWLLLPRELAESVLR